MLGSNLPTYGWFLPDEGWCETFHHNNTLNEGWCDTWHHITIHSMKGGVRLYIRWQREAVTKGSGVFADRIGVAAWLLSSGVAMCLERCRFATSCCKMHCDGCMNVAWSLCWGGSRSRQPCVVPCKVAAAGDERYLLCAAGAAGAVSSANWFLLCVLQRVLCVSWWLLSFGFAMCLERRRFATWCCKMHCDGCMNVVWSLCRGRSRSRQPCAFPCEVVAAGDERYLLCAAGAAGVVSSAIFFVACVLQLCVSCICVCRSHWSGYSWRSAMFVPLNCHV